MSKLFESKKKILDLIKEKPMTMTQISERLDLGQSTVSQHIKELLAIGAIKETENPYSRKWKYYEYNRGFEKKLEDQGYNIAKVRTFAVGLIVLAAVIAIAGLLYLNKGPAHGYSTLPVAAAQGNFVVQLSDPPQVPPGTSALVIAYSSIGIQHSNQSSFEYFNATGTANLLNLTNTTQTIAVLGISNFSSVKSLRLNISSTYIIIGNATYNVTVPQGYVESGINGTANSSIGGALLNMNPTIVRIYSQSNESFFVMVPNVKAIFIGKSEAASAASIGYTQRISPEIRHKLQSSSSIEITNATLVSSGNSTSISIGVKNTGNDSVNVTNLQLEGYMEEIMLGYQGYPYAVSPGEIGTSTTGCTGVLCISSNAAASISAGSNTGNQTNLEVSAASSFVRKFNNYLNFIVLDNGTLALPIFDYVADCPVPYGIDTFIGCRRMSGLQLQQGAGTVLHFNGTMEIGGIGPYEPESQSAIPVFRGSTKILLIPNQTYNIRAMGIGQNYSGAAYANYTAKDSGTISGYTAKLVGVSYVNEQVTIGNYSYNYTLQGFTSTINGVTNYTLPPVGYGVSSAHYSLKSASILTPGFTLLGTTNVTEYAPGRCPVCSGEIRCLVCVAGRVTNAVVLTIRAPDYQYYGPLSIEAAYSQASYASTNSTGSWTSTITSQTTAPTTMPQQNQSGYGTVAGKVTVGPLCPVENVNGTCPFGVNATSLYSTLKIVLASTQTLQSYYISLNSSGSFSQQVAAGTYSVSMLNCNYVGCRSITPKTITVYGGETAVLDININTGIA